MADQKSSKSPEIELTNTFNAALKNEIHNLETGMLMGHFDTDNPNVLPGGMMSTLGWVPAKIAHLQKKKRDEEFIQFILELTHQQILENIREAQLQITDAINRMNDVIINADERIACLHQSLQNITHRHSELNDAIEAKYFEKDADGKYKSKAVADTIAAYEQRTGKKLEDDISPEMLILILNAQKDFERNEVVPALESELVKLNDFRDNVQNQKEAFEEENERINEALKAIDADESLSEEERRIQKAEILEQASAIALDAQMSAHSVEAEYTEIVTDLREENGLAKDVTYLEQSNNETVELNQSALDDLQSIKPIIPMVP